MVWQLGGLLMLLCCVLSVGSGGWVLGLRGVAVGLGVCQLGFWYGCGCIVLGGHCGRSGLIGHSMRLARVGLGVGCWAGAWGFPFGEVDGRWFVGLFCQHLGVWLWVFRGSLGGGVVGAGWGKELEWVFLAWLMQNNCRLPSFSLCNQGSSWVWLWKPMGSINCVVLSGLAACRASSLWPLLLGCIFGLELVAVYLWATGVLWAMVDSCSRVGFWGGGRGDACLGGLDLLLLVGCWK
ncbi:hypothetical protein U1Q18_011010 [Sarracenia purpurea var. burkii]